MTGMKYIMYSSNGIETPVLFPPGLEHDSVARVLTNHRYLISAGFVTISNDGKILVSGNSYSLELSSRKEDAEIIEQCLKWKM